MKKKAIFCLLLCFVMLTPVVALAAGENQQAAENILQNSMATTFAVIHTGDTNGVMENKDGAVAWPTRRWRIMKPCCWTAATR